MILSEGQEFQQPGRSNCTMFESRVLVQSRAAEWELRFRLRHNIVTSAWFHSKPSVRVNRGQKFVGNGGSAWSQFADSFDSVLQFVCRVVPAVIQTLQRGAQKSRQFSAIFHQVQQVLAVGMEAFQLLRAGEELRQRGLPVKLGLCHRHHLHVGEGLTETASGHPQSTEDVGQEQPVSWPKKKETK